MPLAENPGAVDEKEPHPNRTSPCPLPCPPNDRRRTRGKGSTAAGPAADDHLRQRDCCRAWPRDLLPVGNRRQSLAHLDDPSFPIKAPRAEDCRTNRPASTIPRHRPAPARHPIPSAMMAARVGESKNCHCVAVRIASGTSATSRLLSLGIRMRRAPASTASCMRSGSAFTFSSRPWTLISPRTTVRSSTGLPRIDDTSERKKATAVSAPSCAWLRWMACTEKS